MLRFRSILTPGSTIAVVDADAASRGYLAELLAGAGVRAELFASLQPALDWVRDHRAAALLLSAATPGDVQALFAQAPGLRQLVPVLALAHAESPAELEQLAFLEADDWLAGPLRPAELVTRVRRLARLPEGREPPEPAGHGRSLRTEAEHRVQLFQRYADFFESAADGMVVIDRSGRVLFANSRARELTGFSESELLCRSFGQLLESTEGDRAARLLRGFEDGIYPRGVDFLLKTRSDGKLKANVSFSSVLHENNAVLFSFRDVTQERRTAVELQQTKDFLECVIDSSVDGIVSANLRGTVLLFNRAASRIFGYAPEEVIGRLPVDRLYPPGVARQMMRKILAPELSGYGRLQDFRVDMLGADGSAIPVQLSASLVMANGRPIGSVGIFTDIRDKLRIQAELEHAQDELRTHEKQAIVAELAGAAAHELNQPLTSVLGYAGLLRRQLAGYPQYLSALQVITDQAERMAEIVRKVGQSTKYETKSYVGGAKILDLEKASDDALKPRKLT